MSRRKAILQTAVSIVLIVAVVRLLAGRWDLPMVWAILGIFLGAMLIAWLAIFRKDPELLKERREAGPGAERWDRIWLRVYTLFLMATLIVALLDVGRFHWSDTVPLGLQIAGLLGFTASLAFSGWAMAENTFFSEVVRIQEDRGHRVVTSGPYQYVRHPGYAGNIVAWPCTALALGSWLAVLLSGAIVALFIVRTAWEDRALQAGLEGYAEYAQRVRHRLVPGLW
jgi:protein-S-isoprenylcysteine O-methyltransferase Ste14